jgi:hypothetical protein
MDIQKTINYFQFKRIASNRPVDEKHVTALVEKINVKNLLHLFPILVNSRMEVIDGQHRLSAAERTGEYVYYFIDDDISKADIANINVTAKNWSINDYINYWTIEKAPGFDVFSEFMIANPLMPPTTIYRLIGADNIVHKVRKGIIDVSKIDTAERVSAICKEYRNMIDFAYERYFIMAVFNCVQTPEYDHAVMRDKLNYQSRSLLKCVTVRQYTEMLEEIYNYKNKNAIKLKK